jgi:hypothetical protein
MLRSVPSRRGTIRADETYHGVAAQHRGSLESVAYQRHKKVINNRIFNVFDVTSAGEHSRLSTSKLLRELRGLLREDGNGISLLVFVMQGRITDRAQECYNLFYHTLCKEQVKIVMVVTGLEGGGIDPTHPASVLNWFSRNEPYFTRNGMVFSGADCLTAMKGKLRNGTHIYEDAYKASKWRFERLIMKNYDRTPKDIDWADNQSSLPSVFGFFCCQY